MTDLLPGTQEAIDAGCLCPIMDNGHGRGYMGQPGVYVYAGNCSHHGHIVQAAMTEKQVPVSAAGDISHAANSLDIDRLKAAGIDELSAPFGKHRERMAASQLAWLDALGRPGRDEAAVEEGLREALAARAWGCSSCGTAGRARARI